MFSAIYFHELDVGWISVTLYYLKKIILGHVDYATGWTTESGYDLWVRICFEVIIFTCWMSDSFQ